MKRKEFLQFTGMSLGMLALMRNQSLASFLADPAYKMRMLRNNVGVFTEQGGTIGYLLSKEGIVTVDSQFPDPAQHLIAELKKQSTQPFKYLINTHHHGDHTGGNIAFKGLSEHVVAHENSLKNQQATAEKAKNADKQLFPDLTYTDSWKTKVGGETIKMHYFGAGHTNGDSLVHFEDANIVHMGDLVFNRRFPFIDRTAGANINSWIEVLEKTTKKFDKDTLYIFGHALDPEKITGNAADLKAFQNYLSKLLKHVESEIKAGKSKEDILKATSIPGAEEWTGQGIERSLTAAYEELTEKK